MLCGKTALQSADWRGNSYKALQRFQAGLGKYFSLGNSAREEVNSIKQLQHSSSEVSAAVSSTAASLKEPPQIVFIVLSRVLAFLSSVFACPSCFSSAGHPNGQS